MNTIEQFLQYPAWVLVGGVVYFLVVAPLIRPVANWVRSYWRFLRARAQQRSLGNSDQAVHEPVIGQLLEGYKDVEPSFVVEFEKMRKAVLQARIRDTVYSKGPTIRYGVVKFNIALTPPPDEILRPKSPYSCGVEGFGQLNNENDYHQAA